jgi:hypothetical protein
MNQPFDDSDADVILQPDTPALVEERTVDELIRDYQLFDHDEHSARAAKQRIAMELARRAPQSDGCRTTRLRGEHSRVRIEWPQDAWDQSRLMECWHAFPHLRDEFLTIATLRVRLREYAKGCRTSGPADYATFLKMIKAANRGPVATPRIVIEEVKP